MGLLIIGGSDAGISAALRARELAPDLDVTVLLADAYPNFSICGIPYYVSGEVPDWRSLAHRSLAELAATGMTVRTETRAVAIDPLAHTVTTGTGEQLRYDTLIVGTGAVPAIPPIAGLDTLGPGDGVHLLHTMGDTFAITEHLATQQVREATIVGAGYIGIEMAEALTHRGIAVTVLERLPQVLPRTLDPELAELVTEELRRNGVTVACDTTVHAITKTAAGLALQTSTGRLESAFVLVVTGVKPDVALLADASADLGFAGAVAVDTKMQTSLPGIYAAGDCVHTHHRLLPQPGYLPLGTTAHKQGRVAGENAAGGDTHFAGSLGTQVIRVFGLVAAATGLRDSEATAAGYQPRTTATRADDHKAYYPGAQPIHMRLTGNTSTGRLLGAQLAGSVSSQIAKRIDILATALHYHAEVSEIGTLDLSYTPPLGSPYDAVAQAAIAWGTPDFQDRR